MIARWRTLPGAGRTSLDRMKVDGCLMRTPQLLRPCQWRSSAWATGAVARLRWSGSHVRRGPHFLVSVLPEAERQRQDQAQSNRRRCSGCSCVQHGEHSQAPACINCAMHRQHPGMLSISLRGKTHVTMQRNRGMRCHGHGCNHDASALEKCAGSVHAAHLRQTEMVRVLASLGPRASAL